MRLLQGNRLALILRRRLWLLQRGRRLALVLLRLSLLLLLLLLQNRFLLLELDLLLLICRLIRLLLQAFLRDLLCGKRKWGRKRRRLSCASVARSSSRLSVSGLGSPCVPAWWSSWAASGWRCDGLLLLQCGVDEGRLETRDGDGFGAAPGYGNAKMLLMPLDDSVGTGVGGLQGCLDAASFDEDVRGGAEILRELHSGAAVV